MTSKKVQVTRRINNMQTAYLKEIMAHRDRQRPAAEASMEIASAAFDQKVEQARAGRGAGRGDVIEFYEPLSHLDDATYSLVITILDEKIKAIFAYDPQLQQKVDHVQLSKLESARLQDRLKSYEKLNAMLRGEVREMQLAMATMRREHLEEVRELQTEISQMKAEAEERRAAVSSEEALLAENKEELANQNRIASELALQLGAAQAQLTRCQSQCTTEHAATQTSTEFLPHAADAEIKDAPASKPAPRRPSVVGGGRRRSRKREELEQVDKTAVEEATKQNDRQIGMLETQIALLKVEVASAHKSARRAEASVPLSDCATLTLQDQGLGGTDETGSAFSEDSMTHGRVLHCKGVLATAAVEEVCVQTDWTMIEECGLEEVEHDEDDSPRIWPGAVEGQAIVAAVSDNPEATPELLQLREEAEDAAKRAKALAAKTATLQDHMSALEAELSLAREQGGKETAARLAKEKELAATTADLEKLEKQQQKVVQEREEARSRVRVLQNKVATQLVSAPVHGKKALTSGPSVHAVAALAAQHQQQLELVETRRLKTEAAYRAALAEIADLTAQLDRAQDERGQEALARAHMSLVRSSPRGARVASEDAGAVGSKPGPSVQTAVGPPSLQRGGSKEPHASARRRDGRSNTYSGQVQAESVQRTPSAVIGADLPESMPQIPGPRPALVVRTGTANSRKDRARKAAAAVTTTSPSGSGLDNPVVRSIVDLSSGAMASSAVSAATKSLQPFPPNLNFSSTRPIVAAKGSLKPLPGTPVGRQPSPASNAKGGSRPPSQGPAGATLETPKVRGPHAGAPPPQRPRVIGKARPRLTSFVQDPDWKSPNGAPMVSPRHADSVPDGSGSGSTAAQN